MQPFAQTFHCQSRMHCATCRDLEGGRSWRGQLMATYALPGGVVDFVCPHGIQAGDDVAPVKPAPSARGGCGGCKLTAEERKRMEEIKAAGRSGSKA